MLVFLPGQDDIEALQGLLEENLPSVIPKYSQTSTDTATATATTSADETPVTEEEDSKDDAASVGTASTGEESRWANKRVKAGVLKDFDIRPLYAAMPPDEQVRRGDSVQ